MALFHSNKDLERFENSVNRVFENFAKDLNEVSQRSASRGIRSWAPLLDLHEDAKEYTLSTELPGIKKEDINIDIRDNTLYISGETKEEKKSEEGGTTHIQERRWGSFSRTLALPRNVKADEIVAKYENGVLEVKIPKAEHTGKKITIN
nr:9844_t:CDS:2 [Entrophospora candida]